MSRIGPLRFGPGKKRLNPESGFSLGTFVFGQADGEPPSENYHWGIVIVGVQSGNPHRGISIGKRPSDGREDEGKPSGSGCGHFPSAPAGRTETGWRGVKRSFQNVSGRVPGTDYRSVDVDFSSSGRSISGQASSPQPIDEIRWRPAWVSIKYI